MNKKIKYDISLAKKIHEEKVSAREGRRLLLLNKILPLLKEYFSHIQDLKSAYITGSLLKENNFDQFSDIDIAVEGMDKDKYWQVFGDLEEMLGTENIDLIELENCRFKEFIYNKGLKIK